MRRPLPQVRLSSLLATAAAVTGLSLIAAPAHADVSAADAKGHALRSSDVSKRFGSLRADAAYAVNDGCFGWSRSWGTRRAPTLVSSAVVTCPGGTAKAQFERQFVDADPAFRAVTVAGAEQARYFDNRTYRSMDLLVGSRRATVIVTRRARGRAVGYSTFKRVVAKQVARLRA